MSLTALVVEPNKLYQKIIAEMCREYGIESILENNALHALQILQSQSVDLICVARQIGDMSAREFCSRKQQQQNVKSTPVIMLTADKENISIARELNYGISEIYDRSHLQAFEHYLFQFSQRHQLAKKLVGTVLIVEDDLAMAKIMTYCLAEMGIKVDHVTSGEEAIEQFRDNNYDLVLSDVVLAKKKTGLDVVREIRRMTGTKRFVPFLAVSASDNTARKIELLKSGANDFVDKPLVAEELVARVSNLLMLKHLFDKVDGQKEELRQIAMTDQLTGLPNRHSLELMVPKYISDAKRHRYPLSLMVIDLDHFKKINDTQGHATGDQVLVETGKWLIDNCRNEDFASRFGGEEFIVILPHCSKDDAVKKAERLRELLQDLMPANIRVTSSIGVAELSSDMEFNDLFKEADRAVYQAKEQGRNRVIAA